jgi:hypothetical protein
MIADCSKNQVADDASTGSSGIAQLGGWSLVVAVNDDRVFRNSLLASPAVNDKCQVIVKRGYSSAGAAYNAGLAEARHDVVVFAHQDVYLPAAWLNQFDCALQQVARFDPAWGVLGAFGVTRSGEFHGYCYSTGLQRVLGAPFSAPIATRSLDELLLVVRRSSGLRFDESLPGFHLYGTDICLQAEAQDLGNYIISAFCIHNANGIRYLPVDFWRAYFYLRRKWWKVLPVTTCCTSITKWCVPVAHRLAIEIKHRFIPKTAGVRCDNVESLYGRLGRTYPQIFQLPLPQEREDAGLMAANFHD